jgi:hypothetical protein
MDTTGIVPTMPINGGDYGFGGSGIWLFAILALMWGGFGGGYNNNLGYRTATAEDVNNGFNFSELQSENRDILGAISSDTASTIAAVERVGSGLVSDIHDVAMGIADVRSHQQECCCNILRAIDATNYNTTAQVQKVLDAMAQSKIEALQSKVNSLELAQAVYGVVRYPSTTAYDAGANPFFRPTTA